MEGIYLITINGLAATEYGWFPNFDAAKAVAAKVAAEYDIGEYSWKAAELFVGENGVIGVEHVEPYTSASVQY